MNNALDSLCEVNILIVSSPGGHSVVAHELFEDCNWPLEFVTSSNNLSLLNPIQRIDKKLVVIESNRDLKILYQIFLAFKILKKLRPKVIISTGAGLAIPFFIWGFFFRMKLIFIESASRVSSLSLTGRLLIRITNRFYVRSPRLAEKYAKAIYF